MIRPILPKLGKKKTIRIPYFRIYYTTTFLTILLIALGALLVPPADLVYQTITSRHSRTDKLSASFTIAGIYVLTFVLALFIYASRVYTNRTTLSAIPKGYVPVEVGEVGSGVRRLVVRQWERSAVVAWDSRPRDVKAELQQGVGGDSSSVVGAAPDTRPSTAERSQHSSFRHRGGHSTSLIPVSSALTAWGPIEHPGWSSSASSDFPSLQYRTVIRELPNLIEAKAVSLAPADPAPADPALSSSLHTHDDGNTTAGVPDARIVATLQRPTSMGLREYLAHLAELSAIDIAIGADFLSQYEYARFSTIAIAEDQFRALMDVFASLLTSMTAPDPDLLAALEDKTGSETVSEYSRRDAGIASSTASSTTSSIARYQTPHLGHTPTTPLRSLHRTSSSGTVRTAPSRRSRLGTGATLAMTPLDRSSVGLTAGPAARQVPHVSSVESFSRTRHVPSPGSSSDSSSLRSAQSVIRLTPTPGPGETPYHFNFNSG